jgi:hypothetical protein
MALCAAILGLRRAQAWSNPQFWAEDVSFYQQAFELGWRAFLRPMSGYLHTILRAVAGIAALADPALAPGIFVGAATLATLYVAGLTLSTRCPLPRAGGLFALAVVLVPDTHEVLLNLVNLQWVLAAGMVLLLISADPRSRGQWAHDMAAAATIGLTGPLCILLAPLFAARAWIRRSRPSLVLASIIAACAATQTCFVLSAPLTAFDPPGATVAYGVLLPLIGRRIGGSIMMGSLMSPDTDQLLGTIVGIVTLGGLAFLVLGPGNFRRERLVLGVVFAVVLAGVLYRVRHSLGLFFIPHTRARYVYVPHLIVIWLLILNAVQRGAVARVCAVLALWALLVNIPTYREAPYEDMHWGAYAARIRAGEAVTVPTNPRGFFLKVPARPR